MVFKDNEKELELEIKIKDIIEFMGADPTTLEADLVKQMIETSLKMLKGGYDGGQLKLMTRAFKEMRYAYQIFNRYPVSRRISIFGSARTSEDHADYVEAKGFGSLMAKMGWMCITGAADGIMKAGLEGAKISSSFGLSIRLPFESPANSLIAGDPKLITFRYFFTRTLMFLSHSDALAAFPGGFGTQDELFECLTLMQTGKANIVPLVLIEGINGVYWSEWLEYLQSHLLANRWISPEDESFFYIASSAEDAASHIKKFYSRYHSSRYVKDTLVIRMVAPLSDEEIEKLNQEFGILIKDGRIYTTSALLEETDHLELPRIAFEHNRRHFGILRQLIDRLNDF